MAESFFIGGLFISNRIMGVFGSGIVGAAAAWNYGLSSPIQLSAFWSGSSTGALSWSANLQSKCVLLFTIPSSICVFPGHDDTSKFYPTWCFSALRATTRIPCSHAILSRQIYEQQFLVLIAVLHASKFPAAG